MRNVAVRSSTLAFFLITASAQDRPARRNKDYNPLASTGIFNPSLRART
jgi:hypothetical protein